jgi:hypothetical protein
MILHFSHIGLTDGLTFMFPFGGWVPAIGSGCRCGRRYRIVELLYAWTAALAFEQDSGW